MISIEFKNTSVDLPIYNANNRSLKTRVIEIATGGKLSTDNQGHVIVKVLKDLTFRLVNGDKVALLGHNGAGKSSLLRVIGGVYHPTNGGVFVSGKVSSLIDISLGIDNEGTGRENIYVRGALLRYNRSAFTTRIEEIIEFSELGDFIDMPVRTYSSGMHLRLAFAVSTIVAPEILIMDEW